METVDITVIGAGVVGLAITEALSKQTDNLLLVEQEPSFGRHTSSRNSEVIHSGIYYVPGYLKAALSVTGNSTLYAFLENEKLPYRKCGKFIVATNEAEVPEIEAIYQNGKTNGVEGTELVDGARIGREEPGVHAVKGIYVPSTGILDVHSLMKRLAFKAEQNGAMVLYSMRATGIECKQPGFTISFENGEQVRSRVVINAAGLFADKVSAMAGIDTCANTYTLRYCKGEYFKTTRYRGMNRLIYPVPDPDGKSLGIHTRLHLDGTVAFGPNAYFVDDIDYSIDERHKEQFYTSISKFLPIEKEDIHPDDSGIRPQLYPLDDKPRDFIIRNEADKGLNGFINLVGIESPGLTCCLTIAEYVRDAVLPQV